MVADGLYSIARYCHNPWLEFEATLFGDEVVVGTNNSCSFIKRIASYVLHAVGDRDTRKSGATIKCLLPYAHHTVSDNHARKTGATPKRTEPYFRHTVWDRDAR